jgi:hypothetical protein
VYVIAIAMNQPILRKVAKTTLALFNFASGSRLVKVLLLHPRVPAGNSGGLEFLHQFYLSSFPFPRSVSGPYGFVNVRFRIF